MRQLPGEAARVSDPEVRARLTLTWVKHACRLAWDVLLSQLDWPEADHEDVTNVSQDVGDGDRHVSTAGRAAPVQPSADETGSNSVTPRLSCEPTCHRRVLSRAQRAARARTRVVVSPAAQQGWWRAGPSPAMGSENQGEPGPAFAVDTGHRAGATNSTAARTELRPCRASSPASLSTGPRICMENRHNPALHVRMQGQPPGGRGGAATRSPQSVSWSASHWSYLPVTHLRPPAASAGQGFPGGLTDDVDHCVT